MKMIHYLIFVLFAAATLNAAPSAHQDFTYSATETTQSFTNLFNSIANLLRNEQKPSFVAQFLNDSMGIILTLIAQTSGKKGTELDLFMFGIKKECTELLSQRIAILPNNENNEELRRPSHHEKDPAATQAIVCNVANIVAGVVTISQNPHDKDNIKQGIGSILCSIVNLAVNASHRSIAHPLLHCYNALATSTHLT